MVIFEPTQLTKIVKVIKDGHVVAMPTDTVFGLVCQFDNIESINKIYQIKQRPIDKPLQILVSNWEQAKKLALIDDQLINDLAKKFTPGKVTVIFKPMPIMGENTYWKQWDSIAIRITNSPFVQKIINLVGPLAASSCNISEEEPINDAKEINLANLNYIVNGKIINAKASTVYNSLTNEIIRN